MPSDIRKIQHLYSRFGFGASLEHFPASKSLDSHISDLISDASLVMHIESPDRITPGEWSLMSREERVITRKEQREELTRISFDWFNLMGSGKAALREKMALFWHGHFACKSDNSGFMYDYMQALRTHSLGNFRTLLEEVSKSSAMLQFLNNQQNRKDQPNENFAREVMELFTLGRGNYSETDIKEAARAFTGWAFNREGNYKLRRYHHDAGLKTIFGYSGYYWGEDVLDLILERPETAMFICGKLYDYFVNEDTRNEGHISSMASVLVKENYEILPVIKYVMQADWFWSDKNIGVMIKSPIELMAGMKHMLKVEYTSPQETIIIQHALGQVLLNPPGVAGWPLGKQWIDSTTLLLRMALPRAIVMRSKLSKTTERLPRKLAALQTTVNLEYLEQQFSGLSADEVAEILLLVDPPAKGHVQDPVTHFLSQPEFQLC